MKKITESQLKDKVNSLREYLKVYELSEEGRGSDEYQAAAGIKPQAAAPAAGVPAGNRNFLQRGMDAVSDFHKKNTERFNADKAADAAANSPEGMAAVKAKLTPSQLTWLGNAQPNSAILSRMPKPLPGETAPAAASTGTGLKPPKYGPFGTETRPLDGSDDRRVNGQGLKMPAQAPAAAGQRPGGVAFNQDKAAQDNPEAGMGAGQYPRVGPNTTVAQNSAAADAERDGVPVAPVAPTAPVTSVAADPNAAKNPYDIFKKADGSPAAPPGFKPPPPGVIWSEPDAGEHATKVARFKELIAKAKELRTDTEVQASKDLGSFAGESTTYFLNKLRLIESRQLNEALSAAEQKEMDDLSAELGQQGAENDEDLMAAINDYNSLPTSAAQAAVPYIGPSRAQQADMEASSQGGTPAFNAAKDSQRANVTAISTELRAIADATAKLGPNATMANMQPLLDRLKKVETDAAGAGEDVKSAVQAMMTNVDAELKKVSGGAAAGTAADPNAAENPYAGVKWAYAPGDGTVAGSAKMAADAAAAAKNTSAFTGVGNPGEQAAAQAAADKAAQANQAAAVRPPVAVDPRDGAVGQALAKLGVSKTDRLNQTFVDSTLGAGKYKAGSAESNMALQAHFKKQGGGSGAPLTRAAGSLPASASLSPGEKIMPAVKRTSAAPVATGGAKALAGLNTEPPQFPANQAAKTNSYGAGRDPNGAYRGDRSDATVMDPKQPGFDFKKASTVANAQNKQVAKESVGYNELQRIMSLVNHR